MKTRYVSLILLLVFILAGLSMYYIDSRHQLDIREVDEVGTLDSDAMPGNNLGSASEEPHSPEKKEEISELKNAGVISTADSTETKPQNESITPKKSVEAAEPEGNPLEKQLAPTPPLTPTPSTLRWGVYSGYTANELKSFEELVEKEVDMRGVFVNWQDPFPTSFGYSLKSSGKTMVIYWEQYGITLDEIINGSSDEYIKKFSAEAKAYGGDVILSPMHEMNGDWDPWGGMVGNNTPAKVVKAWQHIFDVFGEVSNVKFAWAVNNVSVPDNSANAIKNYYPGDRYVDYVAVDGFNFGNPEQSFDQIFGKVLIELSKYNKPVYILSMATTDSPNKAEWIKDAFIVQLPKYHFVKGWIWFNENKEKDWRVNSDNNSLKAFKLAI